MCFLVFFFVLTLGRSTGLVTPKLIDLWVMIPGDRSIFGYCYPEVDQFPGTKPPEIVQLPGIITRRLNFAKKIQNF